MCTYSLVLLTYGTSSCTSPGTDTYDSFQPAKSLQISEGSLLCEPKAIVIPATESLAPWKVGHLQDRSLLGMCADACIVPYGKMLSIFSLVHKCIDALSSNASMQSADSCLHRYSAVKA